MTDANRRIGEARLAVDYPQRAFWADVDAGAGSYAARRIDDRVQRYGFGEAGLLRRSEFLRVGRAAADAPDDVNHHEGCDRQSVQEDREKIDVGHFVGSVSVGCASIEQCTKCSGNASRMQHRSVIDAAANSQAKAT